MDKLREAYEKSGADDFASFQAGFTAGAVALRERALKAAQARTPVDNDLVNTIGSLSDIPA